MKNKKLIQSYILTTAKYDYSVYEKRILYRIIEFLQYQLKDKSLNEKYKHNQANSINCTIPLQSVLINKGSTGNNHDRIKDAFESLQKKIISYNTKEGNWRSSGIIFNVEIIPRSGLIKFSIADFVLNALLDFSKGYRKYELEIAMKFQSVYSMRFYELFSKEQRPTTYTIENLKLMFGIPNKYKNRNSDFVKYVIEKSKAELDKKSPYTFDFALKRSRNKIKSIMFIPRHQPQFEDQELKNRKLGKELSIRYYLSDTNNQYLQTKYEFTPDEIKANFMLFNNLNKIITQPELTDKLAEIHPYAIRKNNPKGYLISSLKKLLE